MFHTENVYINSKVLCKSRKHYSLRSRKSQHQQIIYQPNLDIQSHKNDLSQKNIQAIPLYALLLQNLAVLAINHLLVFQKKVAAIGPVVKIQRIESMPSKERFRRVPCHTTSSLKRWPLSLSTWVGWKRWNLQGDHIYVCMYIYSTCIWIWRKHISPTWISLK